MINQKIERETRKHTSDKEPEHHTSIVDASYMRATTEHTPHDDNERNTDQLRRNSMWEQKAPVIYGHKIQNVTTLIEPTNYQQAINSPDSEKWENAMKIEFDSLVVTGTTDRCPGD